MRKRKPVRKCFIYLANEDHRALLQPPTKLFGQYNMLSRNLLMTPYEPPVGVFPVIAIMRKKAKSTPKPLEPLTVYPRGKAFMVKGVISNQAFELPSELIYRSAIHARTPFSSTDMQMLNERTVTVMGCGSGGSKIGQELARAGVGHIKLCDLKPMGFANVSRHEGDLFDVGKQKAHVVAERIFRIDPSIHIELYPEDIFDSPLDTVKRVLKSDLIIAATDITSVQLLINELSQRLRVPCVFGGCYEEAKGGEVLFTLPDEKMPCLACLRDGIKQPKRNEKIDYSTAEGPEDYQGEPGLHAAIDLITNVEIQICIAILLRKSRTSHLPKIIDARHNFLLIGGALGAGFYRFRKPFDIFFQRLSGNRHDCPVCRRRPTWDQTQQ